MRPTDYGRYPTTSYNTRHMLVDHLERMRVLAALLGITVEQVLIEALDIGIPTMELEERKARKLRKDIAV